MTSTHPTDSDATEAAYWLSADRQSDIGAWPTETPDATILAELLAHCTDERQREEIRAGSIERGDWSGPLTAATNKNTTAKPCPCPGWDVFDTERGLQIQACDDCGIYESDSQAEQVALAYLRDLEEARRLGLMAQWLADTHDVRPLTTRDHNAAPAMLAALYGVLGVLNFGTPNPHTPHIDAIRAAIALATKGATS